MSGVLRLQVVGGLCSRLRAVVAAMAYCEARGKELVVDWPRAAKHIGTFDAIPADLLSTVPWEVTDERRRFTSADEFDPRADGDQEVYTWKISTFGDPSDLPPLALQIERLVPSVEVADTAMVWLSRLVASRTVGVIVRSTIPHEDFAPVGWYGLRMSQLCDAIPGVWFFVVADGLEDRKRLLFGAFREMAIGPEPREQYDHEAIVGQWVNFQVLKRLAWVVGSNRSSFAQLVAIARGGVWEGPEERCQVRQGTGRYEDAWNRPLEGAIVEALSRSGGAGT